MRKLISFLLLITLLLTLTACGKSRSQIGDGSSSVSSADTSAGEMSEEPETPVPPEEPKFDLSSVSLVPWDGVVEHLFFHPLVAYPEQAFVGDNMTNGIDDWMVTVAEYNKMLQSLYDNDYVLVDINTVWSESTDENGNPTMVRNTLQIPEGKKPLILSFDDVNYYDYMQVYGFTWKLIIGDDGRLWSWGKDPQGNEVISQDLDAVTILDKFVREHPDFSPYGTKGCIALTGYQGIFGYRTMTEREDTSAEHEAHRQEEIVAVQPIIDELKRTGWTFASHTWGHINLANKSLNRIQTDTQKWMDEVGSLIGPTQVLIYPHGARPDGGDVNQTGPAFTYLQEQGFRVMCSVGIESYSKIKSDICAVICDRMHADGTTLRHSRDRYLKFYDAKDVMNVDVRPIRDIDWQ